MSRILFAKIIALAFVTMGIADAEACNRCGIFGRGCRFAHHAPVHHAAPYVAPKAPDFNQNIQFFNVAPPGDLSPRGETLYGVSRQIEYNAPSSALYHDNVRRALEFAGQGTEAARSLDGEFTSIALTVEQGRATEARGRSFAEAFRAFNGDTSVRGRGVEHVEFRLVNGVVQSVRSVDPTIVPPDPVPVDEGAAVPRGAGLFTAIGCAGCHGGKEPKGDLDLSGIVSDDDFRRAVERANEPDDTKRMPPAKSGKPRLSAAKMQLLMREADKRGIQLTDPVER